MICFFSVVRLGAAAGEADNDTLEGQRVVLTAEVDYVSGPFSYQWRKDNVDLAGAVGPQLVFDSVQLSDSGSYTVTVSNEYGSAISTPEVLNIKKGVQVQVQGPGQGQIQPQSQSPVPVQSQGQLANVSIASSHGENLSVTFTLGGGDAGSAARLLARAAGPSLTQLAVKNSLADPVLRLSEDGQVIASNDNWGGSEAISAAASTVGAFPFATTSLDAAMALDLSPARYVADVRDAGSNSGLAILELYELGSATGSAGSPPRLLNVSARALAGAADATLVAGFTVVGNAPVTLLVRGLGPGLARLGISQPLADPTLAIYRGSTLIAENNYWAATNGDNIAKFTPTVGAANFEVGSADAAILVRLDPGTYTAQITSAGGVAGVAQIEVYQVQ